MLKIGNARTVEHALGALDSNDPAIREQAREKLIGLGAPVIPRLDELLDGGNDRVRWEAAKALGEIGGKEAITALADVLSDANRDIRWIAAEGFIAAGEEASEPLLHELIRHSGLVWVREAGIRVIDALVRKGKGEYLRPVLKALRGRAPVFEVPLAAYEALVEFHRSHHHLDRVSTFRA